MDMDTEERSRIMNAFYDPELSDIARVAKGFVVMAIFVLIGVIGTAFNEDSKEAVAAVRAVRGDTAKVVDAPARHQALQQARNRAIEGHARLNDSSMQQRSHGSQ